MIAHKVEQLPDQWIVYRHLKAHPGKYVAIRWHHHPMLKAYRMTSDRLVEPMLEDLHTALTGKGLAKLRPAVLGDPAKAVEVWS